MLHQFRTVLRRLAFVCAVLAFSFLVGCGKTDSQPSDSKPQTQDSSLKPQASSPLLQFHWLGKQRLASDPTATNFMAIWNLPESAKLEAQTLDKLATAPWRLWQTNTAVSNAPTALLRPLLDDLVQAESYLEVRGPTNQPDELVFAIHLSPERAALWQTNLPVILNSLSAGSPELLTLNSQLTLSRSGDWTILSYCHLPTTGPQLLADLNSRIATTQNPFAPRSTNYWMEVAFDLASIGGWWSRGATFSNAPQVALTMIGRSGDVRITGELVFPGLAPIELESWNIPTNIIHDPLVGFMAVRGFRPMLQALSLWDVSKFGAIPNQVSFWVQDGHPALRFFAFPSSQAEVQMALLSTFLLKEVNPKMAVFPNTTNVPLGAFEPVAGSKRLRWRGMPYVMPNLEVVEPASNAFITGGLFQNRITNQPAPESLLSQFQPDSKLLLYDWELTKSSASALIQVSQATRFIFGRNRFSLTNNAALPWIVAMSPRLRVATTSFQLVSSNRIGFSRSATIGLTGTEIHLFAEWLESPGFPKGFFALNTQAAPASLGTNVPPASSP